MIQNGIRAGFIAPVNEKILVFVDGPPVLEEHDGFDWGGAALAAAEAWKWESEPMFDWSLKHEGEGALSAS